jgi:hypothetical protein
MRQRHPEVFRGVEPARKPGSIWPTQAGTGVSKDAWMLGIGLSLMADKLEN